jgi:hypothetical protein
LKMFNGPSRSHGAENRHTTVTIVFETILSFRNLRGDGFQKKSTARRYRCLQRPRTGVWHVVPGVQGAGVQTPTQTPTQGEVGRWRVRVLSDLVAYGGRALLPKWWPNQVVAPAELSGWRAIALVSELRRAALPVSMCSRGSTGFLQRSISVAPSFRLGRGVGSEAGGGAAGDGAAGGGAAGGGEAGAAPGSAGRRARRLAPA